MILLFNLKWMQPSASYFYMYQKDVHVSFWFIMENSKPQPTKIIFFTVEAKHP